MKTVRDLIRELRAMPQDWPATLVIHGANGSLQAEAETIDIDRDYVTRTVTISGATAAEVDGPGKRRKK